ncbi:MAG: FtsW/RodA/SpoVE family cell cycle protein [Bacteroidaceae bacterium]|nr:FtsW/RodA/SpoVE family cell cycle protein [Bacteroidaceae bacterium]
MGKYFSGLIRGDFFKGDKGVWMIYFFLCMISLVEVYSASSRMTFDKTSHWGPMVSQAFFLFIGLGVIMIVHRIPCKWFMLFPIVLYPLALLLLVVTALGGGGGELNGTNRWMTIAGFSFQPSEVAKAALIMSAAVILSKSQAEERKIVHGKEKIVVGATRGSRYRAFMVVGIMTMLMCGLIFADNISTAGMLFLVVAVMMFVAHVPVDLMLKGIGGLMAVGLLVGTFAMVMPDDTLSSIPGCKRLVTAKHRIYRMVGHDDLDAEAVKKQEAEDAKFFDMIREKYRPGSTEESVAIAEYNKKKEIRELLGDKKSQETYAKVAVANSNVIGLGPGNSIQRDFLQHAESDFIFAIIIEELGIGGALFIIFLYMTLLIRVGRIAQKCQRFFPAYLVLGFGFMMVLQALVNMAVAVGAMPVTGQTLPLISKGGSSIIITSFYIGVILSVSRYAEGAKAQKLQAQPTVEGETTEYLTDGTMA